MISDFGIEPRTEHYAALVDIAGRHGQLKEALDFISSMPHKPDKAMWGALLQHVRYIRILNWPVLLQMH